MRLPPSVRPDHRAFCDEDDDDSMRMLQTTQLVIPHTVFPQLESMTRFTEVLSSPAQKRVQAGVPTPLQYLSTLYTFDFMETWAPAAYKKGVFGNAGFWEMLQQFYSTKCPRDDLLTLMAMTNKSHLYVLPFLRSGCVPPAFLRRSRQWRRLFGYFPLYHHIATPSMPYDAFVSEVLPRITLAQLDQGVQRMVEALDLLFERAPSLVHPLVVFRGVKNFDFGPSHAYKTWTDPAYVSTTLHPLHAFRYKNPHGVCCVQRLTVPTTCKVLLLQGLSNFENEWEVLLPRNLRFKAIGKKEVQIPTETEWGSSPPKKYESVVLHEVRVFV